MTDWFTLLLDRAFLFEPVQSLDAPFGEFVHEGSTRSLPSEQSQFVVAHQGHTKSMDLNHNAPLCELARYGFAVGRGVRGYDSQNSDLELIVIHFAHSLLRFSASVH